MAPAHLHRRMRMEKDFNSSSFFSDNERYADIINGIGCDGVPFVKGKDLQELDTRVGLGDFRKQRRRQKRKKTLYRDMVLCYDVGEYEKQAAQIRKYVRKNREGLSGGEYLYGFKKSSRLLPTITFVLYYGEKAWDGAKDLHGLLDFTDIPERLREKVSNYQIHVIEVRKLASTEMFKTDVKQVFDFIRFSNDKEKLKELITTDQSYVFLEEDACDMVLAYAGEDKMFKIKEKYRKGGKVNMCQGLREWMEDERNEGKIEERERMNQLIILLAEQARTEDLIRAAKDMEYQEYLFEELGI